MNQKHCVLIYRRNLVSPQLAKPSYQLLLQGESIQTSLLSIQIDKYEIVNKGTHITLNHFVLIVKIKKEDS